MTYATYVGMWKLAATPDSISTERFALFSVSDLNEKPVIHIMMMSRIIMMIDFKC